MSVFNKLRKIAIPAMVAVISTGLFAGAAQAAWSPKKPVEFIIMAGTGGGADQIARLLQGLITVWFIATATFFAMHNVPGDPLLNDRAVTETIRANLEALGTDPYRDVYAAFVRAVAPELLEGSP